MPRETRHRGREDDAASSAGPSASRNSRYGAKRAMVYCIVPRKLAGRLLGRLHDLFRGDPWVQVVVELRTGERRKGERRRAAREPAPSGERRKIRNRRARWIAERRASMIPVEAPKLPLNVARYADRLMFVERLEPGSEEARDAADARLVARLQAGDESSFRELYLRHFESIYTYFLVALGERHEPEDAAQDVFVQALLALPQYELRRDKPFRVWLFSIARNRAIDHLRKHGRIDVRDPAQIDQARETSEGGVDLNVPEWITDPDLMIFMERLPAMQRQVLGLRYLMGFSTQEIAAIIDCPRDYVRVLEHRALRFLRDRLSAIGRQPPRSLRRPMLVRLRRNPVLRERRFALLGLSAPPDFLSVRASYKPRGW